MSFKLINLATSEFVERAVYDDGKRAAKVAARLSAKTGRKYQVRKAADGDPNWRGREQGRFDTGEYIAVTPALAAVCPPDFYAHIAKKSPDLVAYTKDDEKGRHDKQSLLSIAAFIDVCLAHPVIIDTHTRCARNEGYNTMEEYRSYMFNDRWKSRTIEAQRAYALTLSTPIKFAGPIPEGASVSDIDNLMDQIERIYTHYDTGVHALSISCMRGPAHHYQGRVGGDRAHPTRAYASPDVAIAYMQNADGKTIARALCWPERKIYSRVYAEGDAFHIAMRQLGYTKAGYYGDESTEKSFKGARLSRIPTDANGFLVPYIDGSQRRLDDTGEWLTMYGSNIDGEVTCGESWARGARRRDVSVCDNCEDDDCDANDMTEVFTNSSRTRSQTWCSSCVDDRAFYCHGYEVWFDNDSVDSTCVGDEQYSTRYVENNASYCDYYDEYTFDNTYEVRVEYGTQQWSYAALTDHAYEYNCHYYSNDLTSVEVVTERYVQRTNARWRYSGGYVANNVWFVDNVENIPEVLIEDGTVEVYTGVDGLVYLVDYVDHYPATRERVADANPPVPECWVFGAYVEHSRDVELRLTVERIRARQEVREATAASLAAE